MVSLALLPAQLPQNSWGIQMRSKAWIFNGVHDKLLEEERCLMLQKCALPGSKGVRAMGEVPRQT